MKYRAPASLVPGQRDALQPATHRGLLASASRPRALPRRFC